MSDSFIAIFGAGLMTGVALTLIILLLTGGRNERNNDIDLDMRIYVPSRHRNRGGNNRCTERLATETETLKEHAKRLNVKIGD